MSTIQTKGLTLAEAHEKSLADNAETAPEAASSGEKDDSLETEPTEHPAVKSESDEDVDLLAALDDEASEEEGEEQPQIEDSTQFTVNGEPVTFGELQKGYLRQSDYTQKTQELAKEKDEVKNAVALWEALREDYQGTLRQLQGNTPSVNTGFREQQAPPPPQSQEDFKALVEAAVQERLQSDPRLVELEQKAAEATKAEQYAAIEGDYERKLTANDKARVENKMEELGLTDPSHIPTVFASLYQEAQMRAKRRKNIAATSTSSGRPGSAESPTVPKEKPKSIFEAFEMQQAQERLEEF